MYKIKLSPYAKIFYNEWLLDRDGYRYNITVDQILYGEVDISKLKKALQRYVKEHVILNSHIQSISETPYWVPNNCIGELEYIDYSIDATNLSNYVKQSFDLHSGPLYRFRLFRIEESVYRFIIVLHHLVIDGSSTNDGLFGAISKYYNDENYVVQYCISQQIKLIEDLGKKLSVELEKNKLQYKKFWHAKLTEIESIDLKFLKFDRGVINYDYYPIGEIKFNFGETELIKLNDVKRKYLITPYIYSLCIFALLVNRLTGQNRFVISYATSIKEGIDFIYGAQVNTNFIPFQFDTSTTFTDLLAQTREFFKSLKQDGFNYSYYPIADIIQEGSKSLLNLYFIQPNFKNKIFEFSGITKVKVLNEFNLDSVDPLVFEQALGDKNHELNYRIRFDKRIIDTELLNGCVVAFKKLFVDILEDLKQDQNIKPVASYNFLEQNQLQKLVYDFNQTTKDYPRNKTLDQLFAEQAKNNPNKIAIIYKDIKITYQELEKKTSQVAQYLRAKGTKTGELIAIYMQRSLNSVIAIVSIIKAGGVYIPLDPAYPQNRICHMIKDSGCHFCLTSNELFAQCNNVLSSDQNILNTIDIISISENDNKNNCYSDTEIFIDSQNPLNAAYIMYTSGSTGAPKGIKIPHRGIIRLVKNVNYVIFDQNSRVAHATSISFDISTFEIWGALLNGLTMVVVPSDTLSDFKELSKLLHEQSVTIMCMAPILFNAIVSKHCFALSKLHYLLICGEKLSPQNIPQFYKNNKFAKLINCYGPTESTSYATAFEIPRDWLSTREVPIGKPISNTTAYVFDNNLQLLPIGAIGELCLGGDGLAICYHNAPELTDNKFVNVKLYDGREVRVYKTGDLVRILFDGNLEFIGRNDFQVKIRGHRVELSEIEAELLSYPGINEAVVILKELFRSDQEYVNEKYLVAYYVSDNQLDETKIKMYLATQLPNYMLPSILTYLEKMPLTYNGKIDRKSLPEFVFRCDDQYLSPTNEQERLVCKVFAKILKRKKIGINDDFFSLGGDSLKAISLASILQANFDIKVADIFDLRTPKRIVANVNFVKDIFKQRIAQLKQLYQNRPNQKYVTDKQEQKKINLYLKGVASLQVDVSLKKSITNVLLTGATGYLGCNLLYQLLKLTDYNIFLLVRAESQEKAVERVKEKFQFYFDKKLDEISNSRVFIIKADLEKNDLGLSPKEYQTLTTKIDSVIHVAALVKYYGEYDKFYSINVLATSNLLELCKVTRLKDFHYISTCAVLNFGFIPHKSRYLFTEDDLPEDNVEHYNVYSKTKLQGEYQVIKYRNYGIKSSIYRLGNLAFMAENSRAQENVADNGFFGFLQFLFKMKCIAKEFDNVEISPVDVTAQAIVKLFDKKQLVNNIYHLFNPYLFNLSNFFGDNKILPISILPIEQFIDNISYCLGNEDHHNLIVRFLSSQGWLDGLSANNITSNNVLQNRTQHILKLLNFEWLPISDKTFEEYLDSLKLLRNE